MNKVYDPKRSDWKAILERPTQNIGDIEDTVNAIFSDVANRGDAAITEYTAKFDGVSLNGFLVSAKKTEEAIKLVPAELKEAILLAKSNIEKFHSAQRTDRIMVETVPGVKCWREKRPIEKVGLYIPGGSAPLFSTILMLAIPANWRAAPRSCFALPQINKELWTPRSCSPPICAGLTKFLR